MTHRADEIYVYNGSRGAIVYNISDISINVIYGALLRERASRECTVRVCVCVCVCLPTDLH